MAKGHANHTLVTIGILGFVVHALETARLFGARCAQGHTTCGAGGLVGVTVVFGVLAGADATGPRAVLYHRFAVASGVTDAAIPRAQIAVRDAGTKAVGKIAAVAVPVAGSRATYAVRTVAGFAEFIVGTGDAQIEVAFAETVAREGLATIECVIVAIGDGAFARAIAIAIDRAGASDRGADTLPAGSIGALAEIVRAFQGGVARCAVG